MTNPELSFSSQAFLALDRAAGERKFSVEEIVEFLAEKISTLETYDFSGYIAIMANISDALGIVSENHWVKVAAVQEVLAQLEKKGKLKLNIVKP